MDFKKRAEERAFAFLKTNGYFFENKEVVDLSKQFIECYTAGLRRGEGLLAEAKTMLIISGYATSKPDRAIDYLKWSEKVYAIRAEAEKEGVRNERT